MEGFSEVPITKLGGMFTRVPPGKVPNGLAIDARNGRFNGDVFTIRPGLRSTLTSTHQNDRVTGLGQFVARTGEKINLVFTDAGRLARETSNGSEVAQDIVTDFAANLIAEMTAAYGRMFMVFGNLLTPDTVTTPQQVYIPLEGDGVSLRMDQIGLSPRVTPPATASSSPDAGHIAVGKRYVVVLAMTLTSYISGATIAAVFEVNITEANKKLRLTGIPTMPAESNVTKRVIAVTPAGGSTGGPWFYILEDDKVDGITNAATIVPNNTATEYDFDFTDEYLAGLTDVTDDIFDVVLLPPQTSVYYSKNLRRLVAWGDTKDIVRLSEIDDPETFKVSSGFIQVGLGDDENVVGAIDVFTETVIFKDRSGYVVSNSTNSPNLWNLPRRWTGSGPCGPRAYDSCTEFVAYFDESGLYVYQGLLPAYNAYENHGSRDALWSRINWKVRQLFWLKINNVRKEILIGVALDGSTLPNKVICVDYAQGLDAKRWSVDDNAAYSCAIVTRDLANPPDPSSTDTSLLTRQVLFASSAADGAVNLEDETLKNDNGAGIDQAYQVAYVSPKASKIGGIFQLGGIDVVANGSGALQGLVYPVRSGDKPSEPFPLCNGPRRNINLSGEAELFHRNFDGRNASWFSVLLTNNKTADVWFELHAVSLWMNLQWSDRV